MKVIDVAGRRLGEGEPVFIVAEIGVNHNHNLQIAKTMIKAAAEAGADAVKFQTWKTENIILRGTSLAGYQKINQKNESTQFDMLKKLELPYEWHYELKSYAEENGLIFFSTMEDKESVDFLLNDVKIPLIKVGSGDLTNYPLLEHTAAYQKPIVLSTGMATLGDVEESLKIIKSKKNKNVVVCQCTSEYPVPLEEVNLKAMQTLASAFKTLVGFSDHTLGAECAIAATAMGACYLEKHFTIDNTLPGPDHSISLNPPKFKQLVKKIRDVEKALGDGIKAPTSSELKNMPVVRRRLIASTKIVKGEKIEATNVAFKRANVGLEAGFFKYILGRKAKRDIDRDEIILFDHIEEVDGL
jgi:N-acetylneuraminate synthase